MCPYLVHWIARVHKDTQTFPLILGSENWTLDSALLGVPKGQSFTANGALAKGLERELNLPLLELVGIRSPDGSFQFRDRGRQTNKVIGDK